MTPFSRWVSKGIRSLGGWVHTWLVRQRRRFYARVTALKLRFAAWSSWRHPVWVVALALLILVLVLARGPSRPVETLHPPAQRPPASAVPKLSTGMDADIIALLAAARQESVGLGQRRVAALMGTLDQRVQTIFVPWYLSFGRSEIERIRAYNTFAMSWIGGLTSGNFQDESRKILIQTFEGEFAEKVLTPMETRRALEAIGREVAQDYGTRVTVGLQNLQEHRSMSFVKWQKYLASLPPGQIPLAGKSVVVPITALAAPDPIREVLAENIGKSLVDRFNAYPTVATNYRDLQVRDGRNIFETGRGAWAYYGSYLVYWITLVLLVRSGLIPFNISGALISWVAYETFAWGSWILWESMDFEQTRLQMEPIIVHHCDVHFAGMGAALTDPGQAGVFQVLYTLEQSLAGG